MSEVCNRATDVITKSKGIVGHLKIKSTTATTEPSNQEVNLRCDNPLKLNILL